jgi:hypothetical protein
VTVRSGEVLTSFWLKPIPWRHYDWEATTSNYEPGHPIGFGATEADAIADLHVQLMDRAESEALSDEQPGVKP